MTDISLRHSLVVRITHWTNTVAFLLLTISGIAILMAHPRLYWGETGAYGSPALIELPLPIDTYQSGWGRSLHFLAAWISVFNGAWYITSGFVSGHFRRDQSMKYSPSQRLAYRSVAFLLFPVMIVSGVAMSPAVAAAIPFLGGLFGGHQSSRTVHFIVTNLLVLFTIAHITRVGLAGFRSRMRGMILGRETPLKEGV